MKPRLRVVLRVAIPLLAVAAVAEAAIVAGNIVYTKLQTTSLFKEPQPASKAVTKVPLGQKLKVDEVRGIWLHVSSNSAAGWVFKGNLADTQPVEIKDLDVGPNSASATTATAATRTIDDVVNEYASRHNLGNAHEDIRWMNETCHGISDRELIQFLQEQKKGEYQ